MYIGTGVWGVLFPGCPETYQSSSQSRGDESQKFSDQHQKIREVRVGDVVALPTGVANWVYNDGDTPLIGVTVYDSSNDENQLDPNIRVRLFSIIYIILLQRERIKL